MSKREREESGPEYILLELQDTMEPACTYLYYAKRDCFTEEDIAAMQDPESDFELFDADKGVLREGWTSLADDAAAKREFTRTHWCECIGTLNE